MVIFLQVLTVNVLKNDFDADLLYYPNPTSEKLIIDLGQSYNDVNISISNVTGQSIKTQYFDKIMLIDTNIQDPAGIYFIKIHTKEGKSAVLEVLKE